MSARNLHRKHWGPNGSNADRCRRMAECLPHHTVRGHVAQFQPGTLADSDYPRWCAPEVKVHAALGTALGGRGPAAKGGDIGALGPAELAQID